MSKLHRDLVACFLASATMLAPGCATPPKLGPPETFTWVRQPVVCASPPPQWQRDGDNNGGWLGVRFILRGGAGEVISLGANAKIAARSRVEPIERLIAWRDSLSSDEFVRELSLARARPDDALSDAERTIALAINVALDRAASDLSAGHDTFIEGSLQEALAAARSYRPTLAELLPELRLRPEKHPEPERWRIGYERDTTLAGLPAFAGDDTLITPEGPLLYRQVLWVVNGCPFLATYQGLPKNAPVFEAWLATVRFPEATDGAR
ncbi:MAG: hypothetical protein ABL977_06215 [Candidatus Eisenbacteria bacterium]